MQLRHSLNRLRLVITRLFIFFFFFFFSKPAWIPRRHENTKKKKRIEQIHGKNSSQQSLLHTHAWPPSIYGFCRLDKAEQARRRINPVSPLYDRWMKFGVADLISRVLPPPPLHSLFAAPPPPFLSTSFSPSFLRPSPPSGRSFESAALLWRNRTPFWRHDPRCINPSTRTTSPFRPRSSSPFFINYNIVDKGSWICWNRGKIRMDIAFVGKRIQISSIYFRGK